MENSYLHKINCIIDGNMRSINGITTNWYVDSDDKDYYCHWINIMVNKLFSKIGALIKLL